MNNSQITNTINKTQKKIEQTALDNVSFVIFPFQHSGYVDYSNFGYVEGQRIPYDYETFKRIYTGNDAIVLNWKGSVRFNQDANDKKKVSVSYQLGEYLLGVVEGFDSEVELNTDESFVEYKAIQIRDRIVVKIQNWNYNSTYLLYFYKIPQLSKSTIYRIENLETIVVGDRIMGYNVTFVSINQDLANTGRARQQNILPNSAGQGYLEPLVVNSIKENWVEGVDYLVVRDGVYITADYAKTLNNPVKKIVVKCFGTSVLSNVVCMGRKVKYQGDFKEFGQPRLIFPINFNSPTTPTLFRSQTIENNYYYLSNAGLTMESWKDAYAALKDVMSVANEWKYQGFLITDKTTARKSNVDKANTLFGKIETASGGYQHLPWKFAFNHKEITTQICYGCEDIYNVGGYYKNDKDKYTEPKEIWDHMFDNFFCFRKYKTLPINHNSTLTWGFAFTGAAIGAFAKKWWATGILLGVGIIGTLANVLKNPTYEGINGIISADLYDLAITQFGNDTSVDKQKISFDIFNSTNDSPSGVFYDTSLSCTGFEAELTSCFKSKRLGNTILNTSNIGQTHYENGNKIFSDGKPFLLNGDTELVAETNNRDYGWIIDNISIQGIFMGEISIEFLDRFNSVVWSGIYQSEGMWTKSSREINTIKNTSVFNDENMFFSEPLPYPKPLPELVGDINKPTDYTDVVNKTAIATSQGLKSEYLGKFMQRSSYYSCSNESWMGPDPQYGRFLSSRFIGFENSIFISRDTNLVGGFWDNFSEIRVKCRVSKLYDSNEVTEWNEYNIVFTKNSLEFITPIESMSYLARGSAFGTKYRKYGFQNKVVPNYYKHTSNLTVTFVTPPTANGNLNIEFKIDGEYQWTGPYYNGDNEDSFFGGYQAPEPTANSPAVTNIIVGSTGKSFPFATVVEVIEIKYNAIQ